MTVWVLERCYDYEGCVLTGIFSTKELAEAYAAANPSSANEIGAWEVDGMVTTSDRPGSK